MDPKAKARSVEIDLHANTAGRLKVQVWTFDREQKVLRRSEYQRASKYSIRRVMRVLCLGTLFERPENIRIEVGSGDLAHLGIEVDIVGPLNH